MTASGAKLRAIQAEVRRTARSIRTLITEVPPEGEVSEGERLVTTPGGIAALRAPHIAVVPSGDDD